MRLDPVEKSNADPQAQKILGAIEEKFGMIPNIFAVMAANPDVLNACVTANEAIQGDLPASDRELAYYKTSLINSCDYCGHHHKQAAKKAGISVEQLAAIDDYESSDLFDEKQKLVLRFAEQLTKTTRIDAETVEQLKRHLTPSQLVALVGTIGLANFTNRFNHAFDIELP